MLHIICYTHNISTNPWHGTQHFSSSFGACLLSLRAFFSWTTKVCSKHLPTCQSTKLRHLLQGKQETYPLNNLHFHSGNCCRAQTAQSRTGEKKELLWTVQSSKNMNHWFVCLVCWKIKPLGCFHVAQFPLQKTELSVVLQGQHKLQQQTLKTHGLRKGPYI